MSNPKFNLFTDVPLLTRIGHALLGRLFSRFTHLLPYGCPFPNPRPQNDGYFEVLADKIASGENLPDPLLQALHEIETLASPENVHALNISANS